MPVYEVRLKNRGWAERVGDPILAEVVAKDLQSATTFALGLKGIKRVLRGGQDVFVQESPEKGVRKSDKPVPKRRRWKREVFNALARGQGGVPGLQEPGLSPPLDDSPTLGRDLPAS